MSKNTSDDKFRRINVDAYDEENYVEDEFSGEAVTEADISAKESKCRELLNSQDKEQALKLSINSPPIGADASLRERAHRVVMDCVTSFKSTEIASAVKLLKPEEQDVLMKYIYRGMESSEERSANALLSWHGAIVKEAGLGSIVRVLADRKTV
eukprot:m.75638 g.75638  ORF g.75638 m.75638 type:complete len:154 (-) comp16180_c0_seq1:284-745(-)